MAGMTLEGPADNGGEGATRTLLMNFSDVGGGAWPGLASLLPPEGVTMQWPGREAWAVCGTSCTGATGSRSSEDVSDRALGFLALAPGMERVLGLWSRG